MSKKQVKKYFIQPDNIHVEDQDTIAKRSSIAANLIHEGLTYKHAWWTAFQQVPKTYIVEQPSSTPTGLSAPSNFVFPPWVGESTCSHESSTN